MAMGFFGRLRKKKKDNIPSTDEALATESKSGEKAFSAEDFKRSQGIYSRNLYGIYIYEIQPIPPVDVTRPHDLVLGEFIEMTEGLMTLGVAVKSGEERLFEGCDSIIISYSKQGESFFAEAKIIEAFAMGEGGSAGSRSGGGDGASAGSRSGGDGAFPGGTADALPDTMPKSYIIQAVLCTEPARHQRKHGRMAIEWTVYFKENEGRQGEAYEFDEFSRNSVADTIDISEGGFKGIVTHPVEPETIIKCTVETDCGTMSDGELYGRVIRCYHTARDTDVFEMTVQFIEMDDSVSGFLSSWINKMHPEAINAEAKVTLADNGTEATIELIPPQNNGSDLSYEGLCASLGRNSVIHGIDYDLLKTLSVTPHYNLEYVVARCTPAQDGTDAVLTYHVNMNPTFTPKVNEDGSADFKNLGLIHKVSEGELLAEKVLATAGISGRTVTGEVIEAIPGKDAILPAGKNTEENETGTQLLAVIDGFISIVGRKINVLNVYIVEGDVQYSTGNIDHNGIVIVKGDVRGGFSVTAEGDVVVHGSVESASVKAGGTVAVHGGCVGEASSIKADGNVAIKFIDGGTVSTGGSLTTSYILGANVSCGDSVDMVDTGLIRNGHVTARTAINAKTIGGARAAADKTVVEVGNDPVLLEQYKTTAAELEKFNKDLDSVRVSIRTLTMRKYKKQLSDDKLTLLETFKKLAAQLTIQRDDLAAKYDEMKMKIDELGYGEVNVEGVAYEGLRVIIGAAEFTLKEAVRSARFFRIDADVHIEAIGAKAERARGLLRRADLDG